MKSIFKVIRALYKTISAIIYYCLTFVVPKKNELWVFGCWKGRSYSDNSRELFEYVCKNHPRIKAVWIAKNDKIYNEVKRSGYPVVRYSSLKGKWIVARAAANIQTESNEDTGLYKVGGTKVIQLFHGAVAIKEAYLYAGMNYIKKLLVKIYADNHSSSYWMVASDYNLSSFPLMFECNPKRLFVTGQPRTDLVLRKKTVEYFEQFKKNNPDLKLIVYTPTHRSYAQNDKVYMTLESWNILDHFLKLHGYFLFFKPHPLELHKYVDNFSGFSNMILIKPDSNIGTNEFYEYMHYFDMMISDYSSIVGDYLALDRPIIHYMYDKNSFEDETFKINSHSKFVAGPIAENLNELLSCIEKGVEHDDFRDKRHEATDIAYKYIDTNNCKRVFYKIAELTKCSI